MVLPAIGVATVVVAGVASWLLGSQHTTFVPGACKAIEAHVLSEVVGQNLSVLQMADAICDHRNNQHSSKPLVLSVHGPPGVGKSLSHALLAQALYSDPPDLNLQCPGPQCPGYKVLQGMDHINVEREQQQWYLTRSVLNHLHRYPEALLVIEEYDKLDCSTRAVLRQFITAPASANVTLGKAIILLESNIGQSQLHKMLQQAEDRNKVTPEQAHNSLRNLVYNVWSQSNCESHVDIIKLLGAIDFFLPYFPLEQGSIRTLFEKRLAAQAAQLLESQVIRMTWDQDVVDFLLFKVDFGDCNPASKGCYPVEGARPVTTIMTRYVSRAIKNWSDSQAAAKQMNRAKHKASNPGWQGSLARRAEDLERKFSSQAVQDVWLSVASDKRGLLITESQLALSP